MGKKSFCLIEISNAVGVLQKEGPLRKASGMHYKNSTMNTAGVENRGNWQQITTISAIEMSVFLLL